MITFIFSLVGPIISSTIYLPVAVSMHLNCRFIPALRALNKAVRHLRRLNVLPVGLYNQGASRKMLRAGSKKIPLPSLPSFLIPFHLPLPLRGFFPRSLSFYLCFPSSLIPFPRVLFFVLIFWEKFPQKFQIP